MNYIFKNPAKIGVYVQTSNCKPIATIKDKLGADVICNFQMFTIATKEANFVLKVDGKVIGNDGSNYYGYAWNKNDRKMTFTTASEMNRYDNFAGGVYVLKDGKVRKLVAGSDYPTALGGRRGRNCIGTKADGSVVIYCWPDGSSGACTMEELGQKMLNLGCVNAVNFDGGGSTQLICPDGKVTTTRTIYNFLYFMLDEEQKQVSGETTETVDACPYDEPTRNIKFGSIGTGAAWVQWFLKQCGADIKVDGVFGVKSKEALEAFQTKWGLEVDGICGEITRAELRARAGNIGTVVVKPTVKPSVPSENNNGSCPYDEPVSNVKSNMTGDKVRWLQWYLNKHGTNPKLDVDGDFGQLTLNALIAFQRAAGLEVDGVCGKLTRAALKGEKIEIKAEDTVAGNEEYVKNLIQKREQMLDIIEKCVGGMYVYGAQHQKATEAVIDWSARCFPQYTTATRAARMKKYLADHPGICAADCSGLFWLAENQVELSFIDGVDVDDATAEGLYNQYCYPIKKSELQPLDLVFNNDLTHVAIVGRNGRIYEAMGSDTGIIIGDSVDDRLGTSIYGPAYGTSTQYWGSEWKKFGRLKIYKDIPYKG